MVIYKTRWFDRWARKEGVSRAQPLRGRAARSAAGPCIDADLGGGLVKKRIGRAWIRKRAAASARWSPPTRANRWVFVYRLREERAQQHLARTKPRP